VTGGAGFIGSNLTEALLKKGHRVRILDNFSTGKRQNLIFDEASPSLEIVEGDIRDVATCQAAMKGVDYVFHQAALPSVQRSVEDPELTTWGIAGNGTLAEIDRRIAELRADIERNPYHFDRRFLFRVLSMGHSQFAEYIGARGPNTGTNGACASGTQAVALASDWIRMGRCRRSQVI
jgi:nucleoside-diphosphate-sugar epimerase